MEVFTEPWCRACCDALNEREGYRTAGAGWEGAVVLEMAADPAQGIGDDRAVLLDLHDARCRGARVASAEDRASAPYVLRADPATWKRLLAGETEPVAAVMAGRLRLTRGNLLTLAKYAGAAREMVAAAASAGGTFPARPAA